MIEVIKGLSGLIGAMILSLVVVIVVFTVVFWPFIIIGLLIMLLI
jgi:hypothetical protein